MCRLAIDVQKMSFGCHFLRYMWLNKIVSCHFVPSYFKKAHLTVALIQNMLSGEFPSIPNCLKEHWTLERNKLTRTHSRSHMWPQLTLSIEFHLTSWSSGGTRLKDLQCTITLGGTWTCSGSNEQLFEQTKNKPNA